ncbi:hypothetical protein TorRG33x02_083290, partial [Trema orientale]
AEVCSIFMINAVFERRDSNDFVPLSVRFTIILVLTKPKLARVTKAQSEYVVDPV